MYFTGLFIMTAGIAFSVKSDLGAAPVSSVPYTMTCVWGIEMGKATILFHALMVLIQLCILKKNFKLKSFLQVPVGIVFGYFTTFCNYLMTFIHTPQNMAVRLFMLLLSVVLIAFGLFLYLPADMIPLAGEGLTQAVSDSFGLDFPKVKVGFDVTLVTISLITCLAALHKIISVGIGTVIAAVMVGTVLSWFIKYFAGWRDKLLGVSYLLRR